MSNNFLSSFYKNTIDYPDKAAVIVEEKVVTYSKLRKIVDSIISYISNNSSGKGANILIEGYKDEYSLASMIAILSCSCCFIFIDKDTPKERRKSIFNQLKPELVINKESIFSTLMNTHLEESQDANKNYEELHDMSGNTPAYIIFTSGTTGTPKGVEVSNSNLNYSVEERISYYGDDSIVFLSLSPFTFDSSFAGIFWALRVGGTLVIHSKQNTVDFSLMMNQIKHYSIDTLLCIPSLYMALLDYLDSEYNISSVIVAGAKPQEEIVVKHRNKLVNTTLYNEYGPSECTIWSSVQKLYDPKKSSTEENKVSIGYPLNDTNISILDQNYELIETGDEGQIAITGPGVGLGYINDKFRTKSSFKDIPELSSDYKTYLTGDIGYKDRKGEIYILGRIDRQVKINGFRVVLEEIEECLLRHSDIADVYVDYNMILQKSSLVAYIVLRNDLSSLEESLIKEHLSQYLATYCIPEIFIFLDKLPLNNNGKVDKAKLPQVQNRSIQANGYYDNVYERECYDLASNLLDNQNFSLEDSFFSIGGDSIKMAQLLMLIKKKYNINIPFRYMFENPNIKSLASFIQKNID